MKAEPIQAQQIASFCIGYSQAAARELTQSVAVRSALCLRAPNEPGGRNFWYDADRDDAIIERRLEHYHASDGRTRAQCIETLINLLNRNPRRDQRVELQPAIEGRPRQHWEITVRSCATIA